jgi:hypothetical protein
MHLSQETRDYAKWSRGPNNNEVMRVGVRVWAEVRPEGDMWDWTVHVTYRRRHLMTAHGLSGTRKEAKKLAREYAYAAYEKLRERWGMQ